MASRGQESPMDFQWDNASGRIDPKSPFAVLTTPDQTSRRANSSIFSAPPPRTPNFTTPVQNHFFATPATRPPAPSPYRAPSFTTPRAASPSKDSDVFDSPAENQESPDLGSLSISALRKGNSSKPTISRAPSAPAATPSRYPGRGEIPRGRTHEGGILKPRRRRHHTRRTSDVDEDSFSPSETESPPHRASPRSRSRPRSRPDMPAKSPATEWVETHRELPVIASRYAQFIFNGSLAMLALYALFCFFLTIRADVNEKVARKSDFLKAEVERCQKEFVTNRCIPELRVPAMEEPCARWELCMNRDTSQTGRARASAETFAEIINSFIEPISYKAMIFCFLMVVGTLVVSNLAFGHWRNKRLEQTHPYVAATVAPMAAMPNTWVPPTPAMHQQHQQQQQQQRGRAGWDQMGGPMLRDDAPPEIPTEQSGSLALW